MIFHISPLLSMGPFLWAWHPISTAALVQCPPIAGNEDSQDCKNDGLIPKPPMYNTVHSILVARNESIIVVTGSRAGFQSRYSHISMV